MTSICRSCQQDVACNNDGMCCDCCIEEKGDYVEAETVIDQMIAEIVFRCAHCSKAIVRDSRDHDECIANENDVWFCGDCHEYA